MGTNYYVKNVKPCECCGTPRKSDLHIGKSSAGWKFLFNAEVLASGDYKTYLKLAELKGPIVNEYNQVISSGDLISMIEYKQASKSQVELYEEFRDINGYDSADFEFS